MQGTYLSKVPKDMLLGCGTILYDSDRGAVGHIPNCHE